MHKKLILGYATINIISKALTIVTTYTLAFFLTDTLFGYITLFQAGMLTAMTFLGFNLSALYIRFYYQEGFRYTYRAIKWLHIILIFIALIFTILVFYLTKNHEYFRWFSILPIYGLCIGSILICSSIARCSNHLKFYSFCELTRPIIIAGSILIWFFLLRKENINALPVYAISSFVAVVFISLASLFFLNNIDAQEQPKQLLNKKLAFQYIYPLFFAQIVSLINNIGDRYILDIFVSIDEIGVYGKAYLVGATFGTLCDSLFLLWTPHVVKQKDVYFEKLFSISQIVFFGSLLLSVILLFLSAYVFNKKIIFFNFELKTFVIGLIVFSAFVARLGYQILTPALAALDKTKEIAKIGLICAALTIVGNFILIPFIGTYGSALSTWFAFISFSILTYIYILKQKKFLL